MACINFNLNYFGKEIEFGKNQFQKKSNISVWYTYVDINIKRRKIGMYKFQSELFGGEIKFY